MTTKVNNIIKAYAENMAGLTREECLDEDFSAAQCEVLEKALGEGDEGVITAEEQTELEQAGFTKDFIRDLSGYDGKKALQTKVRWLDDNINTRWYRMNYRVNNRQRMFGELGAIGPDAKAAVPTLIAALKDEDHNHIRSYAVVVLGWIGPDAKAAVPALTDALKDEDMIVRSYAAKALGKIGEAAVPALIAALKDGSANVRYNATWALGQIGPKAIEAIPALIQTLSDYDEQVRYYAVLALSEIGPTAFWAIPELEKMAVSDPNLQCRQAAQEALEKLKEGIR